MILAHTIVPSLRSLFSNPKENSEETTSLYVKMDDNSGAPTHFND